MPGLNLRAFVDGGADERKRLLNEWETKRRIDIYQGDLDIKAAQQKQTEWYQREVQAPYTGALTDQAKVGTNIQEVNLSELRRQNMYNQQRIEALAKALKDKGITVPEFEAQEMETAGEAKIAQDKLAQTTAGEKLKIVPKEMEAAGTIADVTTKTYKEEKDVEIDVNRARAENLRAESEGKLPAATEDQRYFNFLDSQVATGAMSQGQADRAKVDYWIVKTGAGASEPELTKSVLGLMSAQARLKAAGVSQEPADFSDLYENVDSGTALLLQKLSGRIVTEKDIAAAIKIIGDQAKVYIPIMAQRKISIPLAVKSDGEIVYHDSGIDQKVIPSNVSQEEYDADKAGLRSIMNR